MLKIGLHYENSRRVQYREGDWVIRQGDVGDDIFILHAGRVEIIKYDRDGKGYHTGILSQGDAFGEMAFIMEEPRDISVKALTDIDVEIVTPRVFADLYDLEGIGSLIRPIIQAFAERLRISYSKVSAMEAQEKIAEPEADREPGQTTVTIIPKTSQALEAMGGMSERLVEHLPFYVGRYSQRRSDNLFHANALFLYDQPPFTVSRSHCAIVATPKDVFFVDRGSTLGSLVNGVRIGGDRFSPKTTVLLAGNNEVILGDNDQSVFAFTVSVKRP